MAPAARNSRLLGWSLAAVLAVAPALTWAGIATSAPAMADPDTCGAGLTMDQDILECVPIETATGSTTASPDFSTAPDFSSGAPSEMQLTEDNPGIASSESHGGR
jgi:hypothetical protein